MNLFDLNQKYADVVALQEVLDYLDTWRTRQRGGQTKAANAAPVTDKIAAAGSA